MRLIRILGTALFAVLALGAVASVAQAEGPFFSKCGNESKPCTEYVRLKATETKELTATGGTFILKTASQTITCTSFKTSGGKFLGSEPGTAGRTEQVLVFESCTVKGNGEPCGVVGGKIVTELLIATLTKENKAATKGEKLLIGFRPSKKGSTLLATVKFEDAGCTAFSTPVELSGTNKLGFAGVLDLERGCSLAEEMEVGEELCKEGHAPLKLLVNEELGKKGLIFFPKTLLKALFIEEAKAVSEARDGSSAFALPVTSVTGHANVEMTGVKDWGVFGA